MSSFSFDVPDLNDVQDLTGMQDRRDRTFDPTNAVTQRGRDVRSDLFDRVSGDYLLERRRPFKQRSGAAGHRSDPKRRRTVAKSYHCPGRNSPAVYLSGVLPKALEEVREDDIYLVQQLLSGPRMSAQVSVLRALLGGERRATATVAVLLDRGVVEVHGRTFSEQTWVIRCP